MQIQVKKLRASAVLPTRATPGSAAYDLAAALDEPLTIGPGQTVAVPTGLAIALPDASVAAFVYARSGLAVRQGVAPANCVGVVDSDYRGEVLVGLHNHSQQAVQIAPGDRIAQLVIAPVCAAQFGWADTLGATQRGEGGFGSTGR